MITWFKTLFFIIKNYDGMVAQMSAAITAAEERVRRAETRMLAAEQVIRDRTDLHADVSGSVHDPNQIIISGRYKNVDYVQVMSFRDDDFRHVVDWLKQQSRYATPKRFDVPMSSRTVFRDMFEIADD